MSDPLAEVIAMLNLRAVLTKTVEGAGDWRVIRSDQGLSFYGVVLEGGCRLEIDQHEPQILRAGDFILIPAAYRFALTSLTPPLHRRWRPSRCNWRRDTFGWEPSTSLRRCRR